MPALYSRILRVHPVLRDLSVTAVASFVNFVASLLVISLFGHLLGLTLLAEYLLLRRVAAWLLPVAHLGLGVGLPRFVAHSSKEPRVRQLEYFAAAMLPILVFITLMGALLWFARVPVGAFFFGDRQLSGLVIPLFLLLFGGVAQIVVYGFYRGRLEMNRAGLLQICVSLVPVLAAAALFKTRSVALIVSVVGWSQLAVALAFALPVLRDLRQIDLRALPNRTRELLQYSVSRVPGDVGTGALLAVGPMLASHYMPVAQVSSLLVATGMLLAATVSTDPLGLVFLSKISMMLAHGRTREVQIYLSHLMSAIVDVSIFVTIQIIVFADVLVGAWIGKSGLEGLSVIRIVLLGIPFYMFFTGLRSAVDAGTIRPLNARNVVFALAALLSMIAVNIRFAQPDSLLSAIAVSLVLIFVLLAYLTSRSLTSLYQIKTKWKESTIPMCCALAIGGIGVAYHSISRGSILQLAVVELVFVAIFAVVCFRLKTRWVRLLWSLAFPEVVPISIPNDGLPRFPVTSQPSTSASPNIQPGI